jgi:hypothetical protein
MLMQYHKKCNNIKNSYLDTRTLSCLVYHEEVFSLFKEQTCNPSCILDQASCVRCLWLLHLVTAFFSLFCLSFFFLLRWVIFNVFCIHVGQQISAGLDEGLCRVSHLHRHWSEDTHRRQQKFKYIYIV